MMESLGINITEEIDKSPHIKLFLVWTSDKFALLYESFENDPKRILH